MAVFPTLQPYIDRGMLASLLYQDALVEVTESLDPWRWDIDMEAGTLTFSSEQDPSRTFVAQATMLASIAPGPRSMLWEWAHPQGGGNPASLAIRQQGETDGVAELTAGELPLPQGAETSEAIAELAHEIGQVATGILGRGPYYSAPAGGGSRFVFLLDGPFPKLDLATTVAKLPRMLATGQLRDARTSVWALATAQNWNFQWTDQVFHNAQISDGSSIANVEFDDLGRVTRVQGTAA